MSQFPLKVIDAHEPGMKIIKRCLEANLKEYFESVQIDLEVCPNLSEVPFNFPISSISKGAILDVGGPFSIEPWADYTKKFSMDQLLDLCNILHVPNDTLFGPCGGPFWEVGKNSEMVACKQSKHSKSESFLGLVDKNNKACFQETLTCNFGLLGNFFTCSDEPEATVLRIKAGKRLTNKNFTNGIQKSIAVDFPSQVISLGGVFTMSGSQVNCHIMSDFSTTPLDSLKKVKEWLSFYSFDSPMTFASVLHGHDPGLNLRVEHSHGYNKKKSTAWSISPRFEPKTLAMLCHPDKGGREDMFKIILQAKKIMEDEEARNIYYKYGIEKAQE